MQSMLFLNRLGTLRQKLTSAFNAMTNNVSWVCCRSPTAPYARLCRGWASCLVYRWSNMKGNLKFIHRGCFFSSANRNINLSPGLAAPWFNQTVWNLLLTLTRTSKPISVPSHRLIAFKPLEASCFYFCFTTSYQFFFAFRMNNRLQYTIVSQCQFI